LAICELLSARNSPELATASWIVHMLVSRMRRLVGLDTLCLPAKTAPFMHCEYFPATQWRDYPVTYGFARIVQCRNL
jgi:hypothetical protein